MSSIENTTLARLSGLTPGGATMGSLTLREKVVEMTEAAEAAALTPKVPGGITHSLRAAIACRAARLNGDKALAEYYYAGVSDPGDSALCDPENSGSSEQTRAVLYFADKVTVSPRAATEENIADLKAAGVSDPDIVRLCELVAFLAYQYRVIAGLALMEKTT